MLRKLLLSAAAAFVVALSACGQHSYVPADSTPATPSLSHSAKSPVKVKPASLALLGTGTESTLSTVISESKYTGAFKAKSGCKGILTFSPSKGKGPKFTVSAVGVKAGTCSITFSDAKKNKGILALTVTTVSFALDAPLPTGAAGATVQLVSVNGQAPPKNLVSVSKVTLGSCGSGCTIAGPQAPPGADMFSAIITNATGATLASSASLSATVKAGTNTNIAVSFASGTPAPTSSPSPTPTPIPPTPTPSPSPGTLTALPAAVSICTNTGSTACSADFAVITVSQPAFTGTFAEVDNCLSSVAKVTLQSQNGSTAKYRVDGQSTLGTCSAHFQGFGNVTAGVSIAVQHPGVVINARTDGARHP